MPLYNLVIKMPFIDPSELCLLSKFQTSTTNENATLGVKWVKEKGVWRSNLIEVDNNETGYWNYFKSYCSIGPLTGIYLSTNSISDYLARFDWSHLKDTTNPTVEENQAFFAVCHIANEQMKKCRTSLFQKVSSEIPGEFHHYWNPAMNSKYLEAYHRYRLPLAYNVQLRDKNSHTPLETDHPLSKNDIESIEVGYTYEHYSRKVQRQEDDVEEINYYFYPSYPYYSTNQVYYNRHLRRNVLSKTAPTIYPNGEDQAALIEYQFEEAKNAKNSRLLGVKWIKEDTGWVQRIVIVNRCDATCWRLFLGFLRIGMFAHTSVSINSVGKYLSQYNWNNLITTDEHSESFKKAYLTICQVANRTIRSSSQLFYAVSDRITGDFNHYWNPALTGRFLLGYHQYCLPNAHKMEIRIKDSTSPIYDHTKISKEKISSIEVGYQHEHTRICDDNHYYFPSPPYYSTGVLSEVTNLMRREL